MDTAKSGLTPFGVIAMMLGVVLLVYAPFFETTVESYDGDHTYNMGLQQAQMLLALYGGVSLITGAVLYGFGKVHAYLEDKMPQVAKSAKPAEPLVMQ